jgi:hypothetical protein
MINNQMNPMDILAMIRSGQNPQQVMLSVLERGVKEGNPMMANLLDLAKSNRIADIEQIARNMCAAQGLDFDKEFSSFKAGLFGTSKLKK